jgi:hypothetical protein
VRQWHCLKIARYHLARKVATARSVAACTCTRAVHHTQSTWPSACARSTAVYTCTSCADLLHRMLIQTSQKPGILHHTRMLSCDRQSTGDVSTVRNCRCGAPQSGRASQTALEPLSCFPPRRPSAWRTCSDGAFAKTQSKTAPHTALHTTYSLELSQIPPHTLPCPPYTV